MHALPREKRAEIISLLVEGISIRSASRVTGADKNTILRLLVDAGIACALYLDKHLRSLPCKRIECDEIWTFCYAKEKNVPEELKGKPGYGNVWTWIALEAYAKLVPSWKVGDRGAETAQKFMYDLASRMRGRIQLVTDGLQTYLEAVRNAFGDDIDYTQLIFDEAEQNEEDKDDKIKGEVVSVAISGSPVENASTSFIERQNLTIRMSVRRFGRKTNAFSKKIENLEAALALHFMYYNYCRVHQTLRVTPAMELRITDHVWDIMEIVELMETLRRYGNLIQ